MDEIPKTVVNITEPRLYVSSTPTEARTANYEPQASLLAYNVISDFLEKMLSEQAFYDAIADPDPRPLDDLINEWVDNTFVAK